MLFTFHFFNIQYNIINSNSQSISCLMTNIAFLEKRFNNEKNKRRTKFVKETS